MRSRCHSHQFIRQYAGIIAKVKFIAKTSIESGTLTVVLSSFLLSFSFSVNKIFHFIWLIFFFNFFFDLYVFSLSADSTHDSTMPSNIGINQFIKGHGCDCQGRSNAITSH